MKTLREIIDYVDKVKPNQYDEALKIEWLSEMDMQIFREVILNHEHEEGIEFDGYTAEDIDKPLLASPPWSNIIYPFYLESKIDYENAEYGKFNNAITMFNTGYEEYKAWYKRTHKAYPTYRVKFT